MTCRFQLTDDLPYLCDASACPFINTMQTPQGANTRDIKVGKSKMFSAIFFFFLFSQGIKFWQTFLRWWTKIRWNLKLMFVHVFSETCPAGCPALLRNGATWGEEFCLKVAFRPVRAFLQRHYLSRGGPSLPSQNISEGIKPNKLICGTCCLWEGSGHCTHLLLHFLPGCPDKWCVLNLAYWPRVNLTGVSDKKICLRLQCW